MRKAKILFSIFSIIVLGAVSLSARPAIWPPETSFEQKNFLLLPNIPEMNVDYALQWTDSAASLFIAPFDAVVLHVVVNNEPKDVFIISDIGMQRLTLWQCSAPGLTGERTLESITTYKGADCGGLRAPSGIATNAINRRFDPNFDAIYLCDRGNDRILELSYQPGSTGGEIHFVRSIGEGVLEWPVDVAISAYGDANQITADLYVVDKGHLQNKGKLSRFSIGGMFEGSWQNICHPGYERVIWTLQDPMAVSCFPDTLPGSSAIYIADATIGTLFMMRATTNSSPSFATQYDYAWGNRLRQPGGMTEDDYGRIYAVNYATGTIGIFGPLMWYIDPAFGAPANDPNALYYPMNIILDTYYGQCEALILELYGRQSGLRTFIISNGSSSTKPPLGFQGYRLIKPMVSSSSAPVPGKFSLDNAYPNPFNSECVISFALPKQSQVRLEVFNLLGQRVANLMDEVKDAGQYSVHFKADGFSSGMYFYRLKADGFSETKSIVLLK